LSAGWGSIAGTPRWRRRERGGCASIAGLPHWPRHQKSGAQILLKKAIRCNGPPETSTIDGSDAHEAVIKSYNEEYGTTIVIRQVHISLDHRGRVRKA